MKILIGWWLKLPQWLVRDTLFLKVYYYLRTKEKLDLNHPKSYTQKLQWLKLHNKQPDYSVMVDKFAVKELIKNKIGSASVIPLLGVWNRFSEIDFNTLPNQFVLKTSHDSGGVYVCTDKSKIDFSLLDARFSKALKINYFSKSREYPYKNATPRIIAEQYMIDEKQEQLYDYKFYCFHGVPKVLQITGIVEGKTYVSHYDENFNKLPLKMNNHPAYNFEKPVTFDRMLEISGILSQNLIHVRVDLYEINGNIYFGEYTFHSHGGIINFDPPEWNMTFGSWIHLPLN